MKTFTEADRLFQRRDFIKLAAVSALVQAATTPAGAQELHAVRVLELPTGGAQSVLYAQKAGLFRKHGVDADIVAMGSGAAIYAAIVGGSADIGRSGTA